MNESVTVGMPTAGSTEISIDNDTYLAENDPYIEEAIEIPDEPIDMPKQKQVPERYKLRAFDDPHTLAEDFLEKHGRNKDGLTLRHWRDGWYSWQWDHYEESLEYELRGKVSNFVRSEFDAIARKYPDEKKVRRSVRQPVVTNVLHALSGLVSVEARLEPPVLLGRRITPRRVIVLA